MTSNADEFSAEAMPAWMLDSALDPPADEESDATFTAWTVSNANNIAEVSTLTFDVKPEDCSHPWEANKHRGQVTWCGLCGYIRYA